ncbi:MAG TPA: hypothetical protein DCL49_05880 [Candidatus Omnitrophica bacterium]|nr:hypothetical protein [Candidatus Omnitrophota bacterium]
MLRVMILTIVYICVLYLLISLFWRWMCRNHYFPCPVWLIWVLDILNLSITSRESGTEKTLRRMGLSPGQIVLDVGPGAGRLLIPASKCLLPRGKVIGLEIQFEMARLLRDRAKKAGVNNFSIVLGDATKLNFRPGCFDLIYFCAVLGEISNPQKALENCRAALKTEGHLTVTDLVCSPLYLSPRTVIALAEKAGFRLSSKRGYWYFYTLNFAKLKE